jgi:putative endonuclease
LLGDEVRWQNQPTVKQHHYWVYILASGNRTLYTGMTNDLRRRVTDHKHGRIGGFTKKYKVTRLVYHELYADVRVAIAREKQVKAWTRAKRLALIKSQNPSWRDLSDDWPTPTAVIPSKARDPGQGV